MTNLNAISTFKTANDIRRLVEHGGVTYRAHRRWRGAEQSSVTLTTYKAVDDADADHDDDDDDDDDDGLLIGQCVEWNFHDLDCSASVVVG